MALRRNVSPPGVPQPMQIVEVQFPAGQAGSDSQFYMIDDTDLAGTVPYLTAG